MPVAHIYSGNYETAFPLFYSQEIVCCVFCHLKCDVHLDEHAVFCDGRFAY